MIRTDGTKIQCLEAVKMYRNRMELAEQVFEEKRARAESTTLRLNAVKVRSSAGTGWNEEAMIQVVEARDCYIAAVNDYSESLSEAYAVLDRLPEAKWIPILRKRYLDEITWEQIAIDTRQSVRNCMVLHKKALKWLAENTGN